MSIRGSNFENQHPFASDHALVWERCMPDGLLYGVEMSFTPTLFTIGTGFMLVAGRMFEVTAAENVSISPGSGYARIYVSIDTGAASSENSFDQVTFGVDYAANLDSFAELTQGGININQGAAVYQAEVAVLAIDSGGATAIERQMELVSPGAGTGAFAAISVTYPAGSTVTVTDGKITYTAPNTNGSALFIVPYAATWTVTATDGTETATQAVEITTEGQSVSVELSFGVALYKNGVINSNLTGGLKAISLAWSSSAVAGNEPTITYNADNVYMEQYVSSKNVGGAVHFVNKFDLTDFDTISFNGLLVANEGFLARTFLGVWSAFGTYREDNLVASLYADNVDGKKTLDVSALTGSFYIGFYMYNNSANTPIASVTMRELRIL